MLRLHTESTRTYTLFPYTPSFRSRQRRFACRYRLRRLAAAQVQHHLRRKREAVSEKAGIDSALEPRPCVGRQAQLATGRADRLRTEIGAFDDDIGGRLGDARMLAAHDAAEIGRAHV